MSKIIKDQKLDSLKVSNTLTLPANQSLTPGSIFYNKSESSINYSDGTNVFSLATTSAPDSVVIYRPGSTQNNNGVYGDWSQAVAALAELNTPKYLYFDDSIEGTGTITIPTGNWDMTGVTWIRSPAGFIEISSSAVRLTVIVTNGAILNGLLGVDGPISIQYNSSTQNAITIAIVPQKDYVGFFLKNYASITCTGSKGFISVSGGTLSFAIDTFSNFGNGTNPVLEVAVTASIDFLISGSVQVGTNSIIGDGIVRVVIVASNVGIAFPVQSAFPNVTGSITAVRLSDFIIKHRKLTDPGAGDDANGGYADGDIWINTITTKFFVCVSEAVGAAVWNGPF